jgi:aminopeptidase N
MHRSLLVALLFGCAGSATAPRTPPAAAPAAAAPPELRLPGDVAPTHVDLELTLEPTADRFRGTIAFDLEVKRPTRTIWLNATDLTIESAALMRGGRPAGAVRVVPGGDDYVGFALDAPLDPGPARLVIRYQGGIDAQRSRGIYRQPEGDDWYLYTFFEATDARRAFPCFDEPGYKVPWKLTLIARKELVVAANSAPVEADDAPGGLRAITFKDTPPLPSYLVAFAVGPFDVIDGGTAGHHGTPFHILAPRGRAAETAYALQATPKLIGLLEDYFGMPYPYGKLDVAVVPRYWGTMEHPGIVALGQPLSLIRPGEETLQRRQWFATIAVHELGHYWFGDYVTCAWWNDVWLNEALGSWLDNKMSDGFEPAWHTPLARLVDIQRAMRADELPTAQKIRMPVDSAQAIENAFSANITYFKGNSVLAMFESFVGPETFQKAIRRYIHDHAWGNATLDDFLAALAAETSRDVADAMKTFIEQPGVPVVTVALDCPKGGTPVVHLEQKRSLIHGAEAPAQTWAIPVCVRWSGGRACTMLREPTGDLPLAGAKACPAWVAGNAGARGYYRVRYEPELGKRVAAAGPALDVAERMELYGDTLSRVAAGDAPAAEALALLPGAARATDRHLFTSGLALLELVHPRKLPEELLPNLGRFLARSYGARARALGLRSRPGESDDTRAIRPGLVHVAAILGDDAVLGRQARELALAWLANRKAVDADMVETVLAVAAHRGDRALFDKLVAAVRTTGDRTDRAAIIGALGAFDDPEIARSALDLVVAGAIDVRDARTLFQGLLARRTTHDLAAGWVRDHFDELATRMRADELARLLEGVVGSICDAEQKRDAATFFGPRAARRAGAAKDLEDGLERAGACIDLRQRSAADVRAFLAKY